ncbi:hypothetical protein [Aquimarina sediminis]|uniref:hypothetical protein n=1 Tax=Aquimarina sediminis TaxID=2070536 RepID=UPI000CA05154|nr:hypothetical protein [Aquimarina sediminis]
MNSLNFKTSNCLAIHVLLGFLILLKYTNTTAQEMTSIQKDSSYIVLEHPMDVYEGAYKDGKPYKGYFKEGDKELFVVYYYEKGIKKYSYSFDVLQMLKENKLDGDHRIELGEKSIYKDGKIVDGIKYNQVKDGILVEQYKNGKHIGFYIDIFAMHYYNRFIFEIEKNKMKINSIQDQEYKIELGLINNLLVAELYKNDSVLIRYQNIDVNDPIFPKNSEVRVYRESGVNKGIAYQNNDKEGRIYQEARAILEIFNGLEIYNVKDHYEVFNQILKNITEGRGFIDRKKNEEHDILGMGNFVVDEEGKIMDGIRFSENTTGGYFEIFNDSKVVEKEKTTLFDFQNIFSAYMEKK